MAFKLHNVLLISVAALLFFNSTAAARELDESPPPEGDDGLGDAEVLKITKVVEELGRFTLEEANKKVSEYSEKMTFCEVVRAKRWPVADGVRYFFVIRALKGGQIDGLFLGYLVVSVTDETIPQSWMFQPTAV